MLVEIARFAQTPTKTYSSYQKVFNSFFRGGFSQIPARTQNIKQPALNTVAQMQENRY